MGLTNSTLHMPPRSEASTTIPSDAATKLAVSAAKDRATRASALTASPREAREEIPSATHEFLEHIETANVLAMCGEGKLAATELSEALRLRPNDASVEHALGDVYGWLCKKAWRSQTRQHYYSEATTHLRHATALAPSDVEAVECLRDLSLRYGRTPDELAWAAQQTVKIGRAAEAEPIFKKLAAIKDVPSETLTTLGEEAFRQQWYQTAASLLGRPYEAGSLSPRSCAFYGCALIKTEQDAAAELVLESVAHDATTPQLRSWAQTALGVISYDRYRRYLASPSFCLLNLKNEATCCSDPTEHKELALQRFAAALEADPTNEIAKKNADNIKAVTIIVVGGGIGGAVAVPQGPKSMLGPIP